MQCFFRIPFSKREWKVAAAWHLSFLPSFSLRSQKGNGNIKARLTPSLSFSYYSPPVQFNSLLAHPLFSSSRVARGWFAYLFVFSMYGVVPSRRPGDPDSGGPVSPALSLLPSPVTSPWLAGWLRPTGNESPVEFASRWSKGSKLAPPLLQIGRERDRERGGGRGEHVMLLILVHNNLVFLRYLICICRCSKCASDRLVYYVHTTYSWEGFLMSKPSPRCSPYTINS